MPKIIITQALVDGKNVRTVVDGQQRLRALLDYINDGFTVSKLHNEQYEDWCFPHYLISFSKKYCSTNLV